MDDKIKELNELLINEVYYGADPDKIRKLVAQGADINYVDDVCHSVLMKALWRYDSTHEIEPVKLVIELGANLEYKSEGYNCLYNALITYDPVIVEFLLKSGANPNCINDCNESYLDWAICDRWIEGNNECGRLMDEIIPILIKYGAKRRSELQSS